MELDIKILEARIAELERRLDVADDLLKIQISINQGFVKTFEILAKL